MTAVIVLISLLVLLYVGNWFYRRNHKDIQTELALYGTMTETVQGRGFAIRDEKLISGSYQGVLSYRVADGTRVANGGVIADIFVSEKDATAQNRVEQLNREITGLESLSRPADFFSADPGVMSEQIYASLRDISAQVRNGHFSELSGVKDELRAALNRKQLITGEDEPEDYSARMESLISERDALAASAGSAIGTVVSPAAGYFISSTDGYENVVDPQEILEITPDRVRDLLGRESGTGVGSAVGKVCTDFNWYLVCVFNDADVWRFEGVSSVSLDIPFASTATIPAQIVARNRDSATGDTAVVFQCAYMDSDIASIRQETVQVNVNTYTGVLVSEKALRFCDVEYRVWDSEDSYHTETQKNVKGVYITNGSRLEFVQIFSDKTVNGYAICKTELSDAERAMLVTDHTIQLYDNVVVEGTDLYDGKPID